MDCSNCGRTNREGAKFCATCASPIVVSCSSCGHGLASDAKFCDQCAAPVARAGNVDAASGDAVRKTVTVLFCDLVGSTSLGERVDAESARDVMGRYHAMAQQVIETHGGTVAKFIGDGVMALFGVPEVAADDAERAVATGLELQRGFLPLGRMINDRYGVEVGLRVGINTGEVVIADADADVVGDVLNTAARLEGACIAGQVLVGEDTWRLTRSAIAYEAFGDLELRGKDGTVAAFRAIDEVVAIDESTTPFVGRDAELASLQRIFDDAVAEGSVRLATVIGAPGVGKTRLARELSRTIAEHATIVELRCERAGAATFAPIADLLRSVADIDDSMSADDTIAALRGLVSDTDDSGRVATLLGSFVGAAPTRSTEELFFAVRRLVEALGRRRPFVMIVDDTQWAEPLFLDLLDHLAEWVKDSPVLVLGLARPELREIRPTLAEQGRRVAESISLEGLDAEATAELAAQLVGADSLPSDLLARLPESTEGNPLFVRELMKMLVDDGVITETDGTWELTIDADAVEVPPTIQSLLSTRIERMPADERRLVELASVVGPEFPLGAVAAIGASGDGPTLMPTLERLRRKELVEPTGTYWGNEPLFRFHHVLIRDAAYRRLLKRARAELHMKIGAWTEETAEGLVGEHEVTIAYHFEQAHEYRRQLNIDDDETTTIGRRAAKLLHTAADRALARDDVAAAGSLAIRAVERLETDADELPELLMLACEALLARGDVASARYLLKQLTDLAVGDVRLTAWAACFNSQLATLTEPDRLHKADDAAAAAAEQLSELGDHAGEAKARLVRAGALARLGHIGECEAELDLALTAARAGNDTRRVAAVLGAAPVAALWGPSPVSRAGGRCLDVIRLLRITTGSPGVEATSTRCQAVLEALRGRFDTARTMLGESRATLEELGLRHGLLETELYTGIVELLADDPVAAEPHLRAAYGGLGRLGIGADAGQAAAHLSRALLLQGRLDEAEELAEDSDALAGENPQTAIVAHTARAEILAARGDVVEALRLAEEAVDLAAGTDIVIDHANANVALARVRLAAGDSVGAGLARDAAAALFEAKGATVDLGDLVEVETPAVVPILDEQPRWAASDDATEPGVHTPWNEADRLGRKAVFDFVVHTEAWLAVLSPDIEVHDRRELVGGVYRGRDAVIEAFPPGFVKQGRTETIAARGDHLVLFHSVVAIPDAGPEMEILLLHRWTAAGMLDLYCVFNPDDYAGALAELDRLYLTDADLDAVARHRVRRLARTYEGLSGGDFEGILDAFDDAAEFVDHRQLGRPTLDVAGTRERFENLHETGGEVCGYAAQIHGDRGVASWVEAHIRIKLPTGVTQVDVQHLVFETNIETGLAVRIDQFGADQIEDARTRFEELCQAAENQNILWNIAVEVGLETNSFARLERRAAFDRSFADNLRIEDSDGKSIINDRSELDDPAVARRCGFGVEHCRVMAIRGERLVLFELRDDSDGEPFHRFAVEEIDDDAQLVRVTHFDGDSLPEAVRHLGYRWLDVDAVENREVAELAIEFTYADSNSDGEWARSHLSEDCTFVDHRQLGWPPGDKAWTIDTLEASPETQEATLNPRVLGLNERGAFGPLLTWTESESGELIEGATPAIAVMQVGDGQVSAIELFAEDDLDAATARFDDLTRPPRPSESAGVEHAGLDQATAQLAASPSGAPAPEFVRFYLDSCDVFAMAGSSGNGDADIAQMLAVVDDELEMIDHRQIGWPVVDRDGFAERIQSVMEVAAEIVITYPRHHRIDGLLSLAEMVTRVVRSNGAEHVDRSLGISTMSPESGLMLRVEQFGGHELEAASAQYDERLREHADDRDVWNTATMVTNRAHSWARSGRHELLEGLFGADLDRVGFGAQHRRVLAVRGERLALMEWRDDDLPGGPFHKFAVVEIDEEVKIGGVTLFDADEPSLTRAADYLDERFLVTQDVPVAVCAVLDVIRGWRHADVETLDRAIADDAQIIDRKTLGWPAYDKANWIDLIVDIAERRDSAVVSRILTLNETGVAFELSVWSISDDKDLFERIPGVYIAVTRDGRVAHVESFDEGERDLALARLDELTANLEATASDAAEPSDVHDATWNEADRQLRHFLRLLVARDLGAYRAALSEHIVIDDRRPFVQEVFEGRERAMAAMAPGIYPPDSDLVADVEIIACRGDNYALHRCGVHEAGAADGSTLQWLGVVRWSEDGHLSRAVLFDPDDYWTAIAELDRMYLEALEDPMLGFTVRTWSAVYAPLADAQFDADEFVAYADRRLRFVDHRQLGWPEHGFDGLRDRILSLIDLGGDRFACIARVHHVEHPFALAETRTIASTPNGAVYDDRYLLLNVTDPETGLIVEQHQFAPERLDEALAMCDELLEALPEDARLSNAATKLSRIATRAGSAARVLTILADDLVIEDQRGTVLTDEGNGLLDPAIAERLGFDVEHRDVLAIRGERLALVHLRGDVDGRPFQRFVVEEITPSGQISRITHYDFDQESLAAAADHLDERWLEIDPPEFSNAAQLLARFTSAHRASDHEATLELLAEEFLFTDHRPLGYADIDRASWIETNAAVGDVHGITITGETIHVNEFGFVGTSALYNVSDTAILNEVTLSVGQEAIAMVTVRDGRLVRLEFFPDDEREQALARLDELTAEAIDADRTPSDHVPWNAADAHARRFTATQLSRDDDAFGQFLADDVVYEDRRRHVQDTYVGRDAVFAAIAPGSFPSDTVFVADIETVATRGDHLVLVLNTFREQEVPDGPTVELLAISSWTGSGEVGRMVLLEPHDYLAAVAELDQLYLDGLDDVAALWTRLGIASYASINARDVDGVVAFQDPDFTMVDHSTIGWPALDSQGYRERISSLMELDAELASFVVRFHRQDAAVGAVSLYEGLHRVAHSNGVVQLDRHFCVIWLSADSGLVSRAEFFQAEQFDDALACYEETLAERAPLRAPSNVASICGNRLDSWVRLERWNSVGAALADDVVIEDAGGSRLIGDRSELLNARIATSIGLGVATRRVMAVRGQRLALVELRDAASEGDTFHRFAVEQTDGNQQISRITHFTPDALADAVTDLDRRFVEIHGSPIPESQRLGLQFTHDRNRFDTDAVRLLLLSDFELVDNRPLGFPTVDLTGLLEVIRTAGEAPTVLMVSQFLLVTDAGYVCSTLQWTVHANGDSFESAVGTVAVVSTGGRLARMEFFPEDEPDAAIARFEELTGSASDGADRPSGSAEP